MKFHSDLINGFPGVLTRQSFCVGDDDAGFALTDLLCENLAEFLYVQQSSLM